MTATLAPPAATPADPIAGSWVRAQAQLAALRHEIDRNRHAHEPDPAQADLAPERQDCRHCGAVPGAWWHLTSAAVLARDPETALLPHEL